MIGAFWNIRSLNKSGSLDCFMDFINDNKLDFVGLMETKKESFHDSFFKYIGNDFSWNFLPADGTAGGILVGFKKSVFQIVSWEIASYCVSAKVISIRDKFLDKKYQ